MTSAGAETLSRSMLDLSFNLLRAVPPALAALPKLRTVYFVQNRISKINNLQLSVNLRSLELGGNRIRVSLALNALVSYKFQPTLDDRKPGCPGKP